MRKALLVLALLMILTGILYRTSVENYFDMVMEDGDYLNDWLTHLPAQKFFLTLGKLVFTAQRLSEPAPGDYPWEDTWGPTLTNLLYKISNLLENKIAKTYNHAGRCVLPDNAAVPHGAGRWWTCSG